MEAYIKRDAGLTSTMAQRQMGRQRNNFKPSDIDVYRKQESSQHSKSIYKHKTRWKMATASKFAYQQMRNRIVVTQTLSLPDTTPLRAKLLQMEEQNEVPSPTTADDRTGRSRARSNRQRPTRRLAVVPPTPNSARVPHTSELSFSYNYLQQ